MEGYKCDNPDCSMEKMIDVAEVKPGNTTVPEGWIIGEIRFPYKGMFCRFSWVACCLNHSEVAIRVLINKKIMETDNAVRARGQSKT